MLTKCHSQIKLQTHSIIPKTKNKTIIICKNVAFSLFIGKYQNANVVSVFKGRQLCCYSGLLLGFGLIGDIMNDLEGYRWMGSARFKIIPTRSVMNRRMFDIEMDYLTDTWQTLSHSVYGIDTYVITWRPEKSKMAACFGDIALSMYITGKCKLSDHMKQLRKVQLQTKDCVGSLH